MKYSAIASQCLLFIAAAGRAAAFNLCGRGPLSSPSTSEGWACSRRPFTCTCSRTTLLFLRPNSDEEMAGRKEQLRILLSATEAQTEQVVSRNPSILERRDIVEHHGPKLALLQNRLGFSKKEAGHLCLVGNRVLSVSLKTLESKMDWLQAKLNLNKAQLRKIIERAPNTLSLSVEDNLEPSLDSIQSSLELSDKELTKIIWMQPDALRNGLYSTKLAVRLSFLRDLLSIEEGDVKGLRAAISKNPDILLCGEERMLKSKQWIKNRFGYENSKVAHICRLFPQSLVSNIDTLEKVASDLQIELALDNDELKRMISSTPSLLVTNIEETIKPKMEFFQRTFALDAEEVKTLLLRHSVLLKLSIAKNVEPKIEFYSKLAGKAVAKGAIFENPNLLKQSSKKRLKPRLAEIVESGDKVRWSKTLLFRMALRTPAQWENYGLGDAPRGPGARSREK